LVVAAIVTAATAFLFFELWLAGRVLPGVHVWDVDLGGLTRDQATDRLAASFQYPPTRYPLLRYGDQTWVVDPTRLGVKVDVAASVDAALSLGHTGALPARLEEQFQVYSQGQMVMPTFSADAGIGAMFLSQIARGINRPSRNAVLSVGEDLRVTVLPSQTGVETDEEATRQALVEAITRLQGGEVTLVTRTSEPLLTDLSAAQAQAERILSGPISLTAPDLGPWTIETATLADWLVLMPVSDAAENASLSVDLDPAPMAELAQEIAAEVTRRPIPAQFRLDAASNRAVPVVESVIGRSLDLTATVTLIKDTAASEQRTVPLPVIPITPAITTADAPDVASFKLLGEGVSGYSGSTSARAKNIAVGTAQFDGLLIPPGKTVSFNRYLGEVTTEKGYEEGIIIWGNETRTDVGGGLCQVSTTMFRAAFWAGLPITERHAHAFRVSYYEPPKGMDATIFSPSVDLKWVNDTESFVLIRSSVDTAKKTVTFRLYGRPVGRTVEMDGPHESRLVHPPAPVYREDPSLPKGQKRLIESPKDGLDVTVYRIIKENGQEIRRDTFFSRYRPWQAVYLIGTKEEVPTATPAP